MFNGKTKSDMPGEDSVGTSASLIGAGTTMKGDMTSNGDLRIDGTLVGNIHCSSYLPFIVVPAPIRLALVPTESSPGMSDLVFPLNIISIRF